MVFNAIFNNICNLYKGPSIDTSYQVSVHLAEGFQRRRLKCEKLTDDRRQTMDDGRRTPSNGKSSHCLWQGELIREMIFFFNKASDCLIQEYTNHTCSKIVTSERYQIQSVIISKLLSFFLPEVIVLFMKMSNDQ